jgi:hypothetical protein
MCKLFLSFHFVILKLNGTWLPCYSHFFCFSSFLISITWPISSHTVIDTASLLFSIRASMQVVRSCKTTKRSKSVDLALQEHYIRDDIPCGSPRCSHGCRGPPSLPLDASHYLVTCFVAYQKRVSNIILFYFQKIWHKVLNFRFTNEKHHHYPKSFSNYSCSSWEYISTGLFLYGAVREQGQICYEN